MCSVLLFVALVLTHCLECVLFDSLLRLSLSLLCVFCFIVCHVGASRTVLCALFDCLLR